MDPTAWILAAALVAFYVVVGVEHLTSQSFALIKFFFSACVVVFVVLRLRERPR